MLLIRPYISVRKELPEDERTHLLIHLCPYLLLSPYDHRRLHKVSLVPASSPLSTRVRAQPNPNLGRAPFSCRIQRSAMARNPERNSADPELRAAILPGHDFDALKIDTSIFRYKPKRCVCHFLSSSGSSFSDQE